MTEASRDVLIRFGDRRPSWFVGSALPAMISCAYLVYSEVSFHQIPSLPVLLVINVALFGAFKWVAYQHARTRPGAVDALLRRPGTVVRVTREQGKVCAQLTGGRVLWFSSRGAAVIAALRDHSPDAEIA